MDIPIPSTPIQSSKRILNRQSSDGKQGHDQGAPRQTICWDKQLDSADLVRRLGNFGPWTLASSFVKPSKAAT